MIMVTASTNVESATLALENGARDCLLKPFNHDEFRHSVALCREQRRLVNENLELKDLFFHGTENKACLTRSCSSMTKKTS